MTGIEHYREAERQLGWSAEVVSDKDTAEAAEWHQRQAQVHATLALAAATATNDGEVGMMGRTRQAWLAMAAEQEKPS